MRPLKKKKKKKKKKLHAYDDQKLDTKVAFALKTRQVAIYLIHYNSVLFYCSRHVATCPVRTTGYASLFTKQTPMFASAIKDSLEDTAKWVRH